MYYLYGWFYDFSWFLTTLQEHKNRFTDFAMLKNLVLPTVFFEDGWLIFSWITLLLVSRFPLKISKIRLVIFPVLIYTILLIFSGRSKSLLCLVCNSLLWISLSSAWYILRRFS
ncbi:MAG UNVERIFIED_CONTAM: hypothetical protein LVR29_13430 [Microcystis novacekii LVE1205-3]